MRFRRQPNPNRNHPTYCPYCAGTQLFPDTEDEFAWNCQDCRRVFSVRFHGQDDSPVAPSPAPSSQEALQQSLRRRGHSTARQEANDA